MFPESPRAQDGQDNRSLPLAPIMDVFNSTLSQEGLREIRPVITGNTGVRRTGDHFTIDRTGTESIPINTDLLNGAIRVRSVDVQTLDFDFDQRSKTASRIRGLSVSISFFGEQHSMPIESLTLSNDEQGQPILRGAFGNPLPPEVLRIVGMPATFNVEFPVNRQGANGIGAPRLSRMFADAAASTGPSIAGMLASDLLTEAANVSLFVESNPRWVEYVVKPAIGDIARELNRRGHRQPPAIPMNPGTPTNPGNPMNPPNNPGGDTTQRPANTPMDTTRLTDMARQQGDQGVTRRLTMTVAGVERTYTMHVPPSYNGRTPMPMVILLHGHAQNGDIIAEATKMTELANKKGFIAIYPDARVWAGNEQWRAWDTENGLLPPGSRADDVGFMRQLIEQTERDYAIDQNRIYMAGLSNGGMMTFRAAGELSDRLAAIAIVSGAMSGNEPPPRFQMSVLNIHGTEDHIVPYDGLKNVPACLTTIGLPRFKSTLYATEYWAEQNRVSNPPIVLTNGDVTERRFINQLSGVEVNEYTIKGGWHVPDNVDHITNSIWNFFEAHPRAQNPSPASGRQQEGRVEFNVAARLNAHLRQRGIRGLENDFSTMLNEARNIRNGSISPSTMLGNFEQNSGAQFTDGISAFVRNMDLAAKDGDRFTFNMRTPQTIPINRGNSLVSLNSISIGNASFDLTTVNGRPRFSNITGVNLSLNALGSNYDVRLHDAAQLSDANNEPYYRMTLDNPLPLFTRRIMFASDQVPVSLSLDENANPTILNQREIKDRTLGYNPVGRGYLDSISHLVEFRQGPSLLGGLDIAKDLGIYGGSGYLGWRAGAWKLGRRGGIVGAAVAAVVVAPTVIHGIERLRE